MQQKKMKVVIGIYYLSLINPHFQTDLSMKKNLIKKNREVRKFMKIW